ncbi:uncharacterized protein LOC107263440 [Cephus cinctus]|uniref:Uncharacterized protein LOC107263440 n=1 Tax=Cephus cinctus TaxID=211228 RepID=A0AAJ7BHI4_CEPCN|nr:uncharacterized protein LOC107263440 [Cephus cinctus]
MNTKLLHIIAILFVFVLLQESSEAKKVLIHVPYRIKNVKHTHTIYKIIPHHHESHDDHHGYGHENEHYEFYRK